MASVVWKSVNTGYIALIQNLISLFLTSNRFKIQNGKYTTHKGITIPNPTKDERNERLCGMIIVYVIVAINTEKHPQMTTPCKIEETRLLNFE